MKKTLNKSEIKKLNETIINLCGLNVLNKKDNVQIIKQKSEKQKEQNQKNEAKKNEYILINNKPAFFFYDDKPYPSLKFLLNQKKEIDLAKTKIKKVVVDMGSIKYLCSGADVMKPGITNLDLNINKDDFVVVIDEKNFVPILVGVALFDSETIKNMDSGKVIKNVHYVSDDKWNL